MIMFPGYEGTEKLYQSARTAVYRGRRSDDGLPVIVKLLRTDAASMADLARQMRQ